MLAIEVSLAESLSSFLGSEVVVVSFPSAIEVWPVAAEGTFATAISIVCITFTFVLIHCCLKLA